MNIQHSAKSVEHYTPANIVEAARATMGGIDLDPASCELANQTVKATAFYGPGSPWFADGLAVPWIGRVFCNPPGGRIAHKSSAATWWAKLANAWKAGEVEQAIFVGFTLEILRSAQNQDCPQPLDFPLCVPRQRIKFDTPNGPGKSPPHANVIVYLPPPSWTEKLSTLPIPQNPVDAFRDNFESIGRVRV